MLYLDFTRKRLALKGYESSNPHFLFLNIRMKFNMVRWDPKYKVYLKIAETSLLAS